MLGKEINSKTLEKLRELHKKYQISLVGECGEYESLVLDAPFYKKRIEIVDAETNYKTVAAFLL